VRHTCCCSRTKDEKDIQGRWKNRAQVSDAYDNLELPYPDTKVANKLCIGGLCFYLLSGEQANDGDNDANSTMMIKTFLLTHVVPNMRRRMSESCSFSCGLFILLTILPHRIFANRLNVNSKKTLRDAGVANVDDPDFNPFKKVLVIVSGDKGSVFIEVVDSEILADGNNPIAGGTGICKMLLTLQSGVSQLRRDVQDVKLTQRVDRATILNQLQIKNKNMKRLKEPRALA
jgi:hypothetical protein